MSSYSFCSYDQLQFNGTISGDEFIVGTDTYHLPSIPTKTTGHIFIPEQCLINNKRYYIKRFEKYAFYHTRILSITFSPLVEELSYGILEYCSRITFADLSMTKIKYLPMFCFSMCYNLTEILFPTTIKEIKLKSFHRMNLLKHLTIPYRVTTINSQAFVETEIEDIYYCKTYAINTYSITSLKNVYVPLSYSGGDLFGISVTKASFTCHHQASVVIHCSTKHFNNLLSFVIICLS